MKKLILSFLFLFICTGVSAAPLESLSELTSPASDDLLYIVDDSATGQKARKIKYSNISAGGGNSLGSNLSSTSNEIYSDTGTVCLGGEGGSNNENICFDFETTSNKIGLTSNTGGIHLVSDLGIVLNDGQPIYYGTGFDTKQAWTNTGNDNLQLGLRVGSATDSGYFSIMEYSDMGNANRSPSGTSADPVLRVYSADVTQANDYIEMYHDQSNSYIASGSGGDMIFDSAQRVRFDSAWNIVQFEVGGTNMLSYHLDVSSAEIAFAPSDLGGNQIVITNDVNKSKDHDHPTTTDPTIFIQSDTNPDSNNTQWLSLYHNKSDGIIDLGTGNLKIDDSIYIDEFLIFGIDSRTIASSGDANPATLSLNPTASRVEINCQDTDSCDITWNESGVPDGSIIHILSVSGNTTPIDFTDNNGTFDLNGNFAMNDGDVLSIIKLSNGDWHEVSRSAN